MNEAKDLAVFWWHSSKNLSPKVTPTFLERQRRILMPAQYAREHQNTWVDAADGFTSAAEVDAAMAHGWTEQLEGRPGVDYVAFVDLGAVHDPSVIAVGHVEAEVAYIDKLTTFQGSREEPVQLATVEQAIRDLAERFHLTKVRVESWQGMGAAQSLERAGLNVELFSPTAKAHAEEWPILAQRLASRTLVLPPHARLREELLGLLVELGPAGVRVIDRGQVHQDHAVAVRGVVASFAQRTDSFFAFFMNGWGLRKAPAPVVEPVPEEPAVAVVPAPAPAPGYNRFDPAAHLTPAQRAERERLNAARDRRVAAMEDRIMRGH